MLENPLYRNLVEKKYGLSVPGYRDGEFADVAAAALVAAMQAQAFSKNPAFEADDYFQEMMLKAIEKASYFSAVKYVRGVVYSTTRNIAIDKWKKTRDWTGTNENLIRVPIEGVAQIPVPDNDFIETDKAERIILAGAILKDLLKARKRQMRTEFLRSDSKNPLSIDKTAKVLCLSKKAITNHRRSLRDYVWNHHADLRRQLFGPHRSPKAKRHGGRGGPKRSTEDGNPRQSMQYAKNRT